MASVRVDKPSIEKRYKLLGKLLKTSRWDAIGRMVEVWEYCTDQQTYSVTEAMLDSIGERDDFAKCLVESGFAEREKNGKIRIKGTEGRIEWLASKREASKKGGESTKAKWEAKHRAETGPDGMPNEGPLTLTPSLTPSLTLSTSPVPTTSPAQTLTKKELKADSLRELPPSSSKVSKLKTDPQKIRAFIAAYAEAYGKRYHGDRPACLDDGKTIGEISRFLQHRTLDKATQLIQAYLQMGDAWFCEHKAHDFTTFAQNITKIQAALKTGRENPNQKSLLEFMREKGDGRDAERV
jgi:hypothetical protein